MNTARYQDPYLAWIWGFFGSGLLLTGLAIPGYLYGTESMELAGISVRYPAAARKLPLSIIGAGLTLMAWWETKNREEWLEQHQLDRLHALQLAEIEHEAALEAYRYRTLMQQAEQVYGTMNAYLEQPQSMQHFPMPVDGGTLPSTSMPVDGSTLPPNPIAPQPLPGEGGLPVRDLTAEIAQYEGHVLIASRTRSGKTTSIQSAVRHTHQRYNGQVDIWYFDPKGAALCGIEKNPERYLFCNKPQHIPQVIERLETLMDLMGDRQEQRMQQGGHYRPGTEPVTTIIAIDEFNSLLSIAKGIDESFPSGKSPRLKQKIIGYVERFIWQGAEDRVYIWLMAQTTRVKSLGLDTSVQDNMAYFSQSRMGDYQSVEDAISNPYVVSNSAERSRLWTVLQTYRHDRSQNLHVPIAFTTLGGNQLCKLPDLSEAKHHQIHAGSPVTPPYELPQAPRDIRHQLEFLLHQSPGFEQETDGEEDDHSPDLTPLHHKLISYATDRGWLTLGQTKKNWGDNNGVPSSQLEKLISDLIDAGVAETRHGDGTRNGAQWRILPSV